MPRIGQWVCSRKSFYMIIIFEKYWDWMVNFGWNLIIDQGKTKILNSIIYFSFCQLFLDGFNGFLGQTIYVVRNINVSNILTCAVSCLCSLLWTLFFCSLSSRQCFLPHKCLSRLLEKYSFFKIVFHKRSVSSSMLFQVCSKTKWCANPTRRMLHDVIILVQFSISS